MKKYYVTAGLLIVVIALLAVAVVKFAHPSVVTAPVACTQEAMICPDGSSVGRTGPDCSFAPCPGAATSTSTTQKPLNPVPTVPPQAKVPTVTSNYMGMTLHFKVGEQFILDIGNQLKWNVAFSPDGIVKRIASTTDSTGQGIYQAISAGTTTLSGTGAPICTPGQMCPDFLEAMKITFVVQ